MNISQIDEHEFWTDGKVIYKRAVWCESPTATFVDVVSEKRISGSLAHLELQYKLKPFNKNNTPEFLEMLLKTIIASKEVDINGIQSE